MRPLSADPRYPRAPAVGPRSHVQMAAPQQKAPKMRRAAPSRLAFRLERLWLTPFVRLVTRIGVPVFCVTLGLGLWLGDSGRRADLVERYEIVKAQIQNRPEFRISELTVDGASAEVEDAVRALLPVGLPASRFAIDLDAYRAAIRRLDAVENVALMVQSGGALEVRVTERVPVILWRTATGIEMLDTTGHRTASLTRRDARPDLPLIAGYGADKAVPEALAILAAAKPILPRARGLVRVGERRWDLVLDRDQRILLPEENPVRAVQRTLALDSVEDLLSRDFTRLDLRNETRPTIRLSEAALTALHEIKGLTPAKASHD
ncbi:cell division protein FtsQ [Rhodobacter sp. JA431]|uniref:cell division protein FtsQ/DivIB n=1 Tax=Rhodobacter sp. JA431 TaxID=570013 RepID=UPI000BCE3792|nr:cell division protein FtsQ/DivIB [Rhodobacter sp. JA431]SOC05652.1 cell division protein FtsQ [Rhodobacter sp. JA431]